MRRLVGYDLNGWRDFAVRNWPEQPGEDENDLVEQVVSGGDGGVVVGLGHAGHNALVGGVQALRAPHGLGSGWGTIGASDRRTRVAHLIADPTRNVAELAAALLGMADPAGAGWRGPTTAVLAIPDAGADEEVQEALLQTLRSLRAPGDSLLVWRPGLACLAALEIEALQDVAQIGVVGHGAVGLTSQKLDMRRDRNAWAPERRGSGRLHAWGGGLDALQMRAWLSLKAASAMPDRIEHFAAARCLVPLALGEAPEAEAMPLTSGGWDVVPPTMLDYFSPNVSKTPIIRVAVSYPSGFVAQSA